MKGKVMPALVQMEPEVLKNLVTEVKETIATDVPELKKPVQHFSIVDLWNIRRNSISARNRFKG